MRRVLVTALVLIAAGAVAVLASGASDEGSADKPRYWVQLDNAFGLIEGSDFKIAGVRAGKITDLRLDRRAKKALVQFELQQKGSFTQLRTDVFCETRPQSLIGEYFLECNPGKAPTKIKPGSTIPVRQTASTIPADLVNNILRLPERERLRIILNELGTTTAARGDDLNEAIRRGVPAIRETDRLLAILARQAEVIGELNRNADSVITALANNRENVGRFVIEARDTAAASAERQADIAATFNRLPRFLAELTPTMRELGRTADAQTPALRDLNATAGQLERFFDNLGPFADASRPSFRSLGEASVVGRQAVLAARPTVRELRRFARNTPELGKNLAITLEDLYRRDRAVERDARAPGESTGWNGLEAVLGYVFWQSQAINIFDRHGYILKVAVYDNHCAPYKSAESVRSHPELIQECASWMGPNQPGVTSPDPTTGNAQTPFARQRAQQQQQEDAQVLQAGRNAAGPAPGGAAPSAPSAPRRTGPPIDLGRSIDQLLGGLNLPAPGGGGLPQSLGQNSQGQVSPQTAQELLDYLLSS